MKTKKLFSVLDDFDFRLLDDPEFKEDSVREEIVVPIIKGLGYSAAKPNQIIRSRKLLHPYVSIGSKQKEVYIIPDYLFEVNGKPAWVLDAKSPTERIVKSENVEQAYSYAIHSEVRVDLFALCNGKEFVLYNTREIDPVLYFPTIAIPLYWENLKKYLAPERIFANDNFKLAKDLGLHLKRLGFDQFEGLVFPDVPISHIGQLDPNMFTTSGGLQHDDTRYVVTFDFSEDILDQLKGRIPDKALEILQARSPDSRKSVQFADHAFLATVHCKIGEMLQENEGEIFLPLIVNRFLD